jgi:hypothetical protein
MDNEELLASIITGFEIQINYLSEKWRNEKDPISKEGFANRYFVLEDIKESLKMAQELNKEPKCSCGCNH